MIKRSYAASRDGRTARRDTPTPMGVGGLRRAHPGHGTSSSQDRPSAETEAEDAESAHSQAVDREGPKSPGLEVAQQESNAEVGTDTGGDTSSDHRPPDTVSCRTGQ